MIYIKSAGEVEKMRQSGLILAECFEVLKPYIKPGIKTIELDKITKEYMEPSMTGMDKNKSKVTLYIGCRTIPYSPVSITFWFS